ncbi:MAG TPA: Ku protein [Mesorhizobium sp.]|nr:Ku protein [Mesorhizobium sp.]
MAPRAVWKGFLKLGSVSCTVKLAGATTESEKLHFRTLNSRTKTPVRSVYVDEETGEAVDNEDQLRGYEIDDGDFVAIEPAEIKKIKDQSQHTLEIEQFVDPTQVPSIYREKPYYLYPADDVASEAFAVIREAMARKKTAGIARIVLYQRERPAIVEAMDKGMLMTTLRYEDWVIDAKDVFSGLKKLSVDPEMAEIAALIIDKKVGKFDPSEFEDTYENALLEMIKAKQHGKEPPKPVPAPRENVIDLAAILRKSLQQEGGVLRQDGKRGRQARKPRGTSAQHKRA